MKYFSVFRIVALFMMLAMLLAGCNPVGGEDTTAATDDTIKTPYSVTESAIKTGKLPGASGGNSSGTSAKTREGIFPPYMMRRL